MIEIKKNFIFKKYKDKPKNTFKLMKMILMKIHINA